MGCIDYQDNEANEATDRSGEERQKYSIFKILSVKKRNEVSEPSFRVNVPGEVENSLSTENQEAYFNEAKRKGLISNRSFEIFREPW